MNNASRYQICLLHEPSSAPSTAADTPFVSIKGDPSLRETVPCVRASSHGLTTSRRKANCASRCVTPRICDLCRLHSSEVRTESIFNPFAYEVHDADDLVKPGYTARHFVNVPYEEKTRTIAWVRAMIQTGPLRHYLPARWLKLMDDERTGWKPLAVDQVDEIVQSFNVLRSIEGYYLRNAAISLSEGIVRASYNCDGTYIVRADYFPEFVRINTP
jgi:hypothetical protein